MDKNSKLVLDLSAVRHKDIHLVGGKAAGLGEMISGLAGAGVKVPDGFVVTTNVWDELTRGIKKDISMILKGVSPQDLKGQRAISREVRSLVEKQSFSDDAESEIRAAYRMLSEKYGALDINVAVRSSATAEDLGEASFAGQQETILNVTGERALFTAIKECFSSVFTERAIFYRKDRGFPLDDIKMAVCVQKLVGGEHVSAGVMFTIDSDSGFDKVVVIESSWGLGESVVRGDVIPDEFMVFKPLLHGTNKPIIERQIGEKHTKLVAAGKKLKIMRTTDEERKTFSITDQDVLWLAETGVRIEKHFSTNKDKKQHMDIEWVKNGDNGEIYILQARPETVHAISSREHKEYRLVGRGRVIATGVAVGEKIASGRALFVDSPERAYKVRQGDILIAERTDPDWEPVMKRAAGIITARGGRTSHASIISRELGIPCIVGVGDDARRIKKGLVITMDCSSGHDGKVYEGLVEFEVLDKPKQTAPKTKTKIMLNVSSPDEALKNGALPVDGVGLGRIEFIISSKIQAHPSLLLAFPKVPKKYVYKLDYLTAGYEDKKEFYIEKLAEGVSKIAAAFYPKDVIIRFSDFKSNEYKRLLGGELYEPAEENPMIGLRGAMRYYHPDFEAEFLLECKAMLRARETKGFKNVIPMVPFCRTPEEGERVAELIRQGGLWKEGERVYVMCEVPSNIILADKFLDIFDGFSIGSNDLTQLIFGIDRDSGLGGGAIESHEALRAAIKSVITKCKERGKYIGICGQAPSDHPEFAKFLVEQGIESISLNPDAVLKTASVVAEFERKERLVN